MVTRKPKPRSKKNSGIYTHIIGVLRECSTKKDRLALVGDCLEEIEHAAAAGKELLIAWQTENAILQAQTEMLSEDEIVEALQDADEAESTDIDTRGRESDGAGLFAYLKRPRMSVKRATLAVLYFRRAPMTPAEITEELKHYRYNFGKGDPGDQVRAALWHARKGGVLVRGKDSRQEFASEEARSQFARAEALRMI